VKKRRQQPLDERRRAQVEVNLLAENEGGRAIRTRGRGCALPFLGGTGLFVIVLEAARAGLG
jgi:hypothetical protein